MRWRWLLLALGLLVAGFAWLALTPAPAVRQGPLVVTIPPHHGLLGIADRLAQAQVIRSRPAFVVATLVRGTPRSLKAGEYEIPRDATIVDIVALLESGRVRQHAILHPEGATQWGGPSSSSSRGSWGTGGRSGCRSRRTRPSSTRWPRNGGR